MADMNTIMMANLHSDIASRIMIEITSGPYNNEDDIYKLANNFDWLEWFSPDMTIKVATNAIKSPLRSLEFITLRVKDAICDSFMHKTNSRPYVDKHTPDIRIYNFLTQNLATIYLDTSGEALFKRGYRSYKSDAPLKENLAAGLVKLSKWNYQETLIDPMCGSGTIIIEAIHLALDIAPGLNRKFAFEKFGNFYQKSWDTIKFNAKQAIKKDIPLKIFANDINPQAILNTSENLRHTKLREYVEFSTKNFLDIMPPSKSGILLTNPPYGVRLDELEALARFYPQIATHLKNNFSNWQCFFLTHDLLMPKLMRLKPSKKIPLFNGALDCRFYEFKMVAGQNR